MSYVHITTTAQAERAKEMAAGRKVALREADERSAERRGEVRQVRALDGLGLSVRSQASGRRYREMCDLVVSVLGKMVDAFDHRGGGDEVSF